MNKDLLKGKTIEIDSFNFQKNNFLSNGLVKSKPMKLIPIIRFKPS